MKIYIPTFRRVNTQITFNNLPDKYKEKVIMVVQEQEKDQYKYDCEYLIVDNNIGISKTRKHIMFHAGKSKFCMYDDDIVFYRRNAKYICEHKDCVRPIERNNDMQTSKRIMTENDFDEMYNMFSQWMDNDNVIQIGHRLTFLPPHGCFGKDFKDVRGATMINGLEVSKFIDEIDWDYVSVGEDSMMTLEFCLRGYKIRQSDIFTAYFKYFQEGGCSVYRDAKTHNEEHEKLMKKYSNFIFYKKNRKTKSEIFDRKHIGQIYEQGYKWKEAYDSYYNSSLKDFIK